MQDNSKRPRVPFTCKCKNRKSYNWRQRVRQKHKCQILANAAKSSVCLAPCTQTEAFLAQEVTCPGERMWNHFSVRKKILFVTLLSCEEKMLWYWRWIIWKTGNSPQTAYGLPSFYHNILLFAKLRREHASKNSSSSQDETNYIHFVQGQQLLVSPKFWSKGDMESTASYRCFPQSLLLWASGQNRAVAGDSRSAPVWALACINQSIWCDAFVLLRKPYKAVNLISSGLHLLVSLVP